MSGAVVLHDYWRSSAAYRVRIALNLKRLAYRSVTVDLTKGEQAGEGYRARNPQGLVPALEIDGQFIAQSLAIIDYLDARCAEGPRLLPAEPMARAQVLSQAMVIVADIHPINNLRVQNWLKHKMGADEAAVTRWLHHWMAEGFAALEALAPADGLFGGAQPNLVDVCLVPQVYNARRFGMALDAFPRLVRIDAEARAIAGFSAAAPENVRPAR